MKMIVDSFRVMAEERGDDQTYFRSSNSEENLSEQLIR